MVHIYKQIYGEILTLEREEGNNRHDKLVVSLLKDATTVIGHVPREFRRCFGTSSGTEGSPK